MSNRIRLVLLYGGKSGEHEISLISAASVLTHLDPKRYEIIPVAMDKDGLCYRQDYQSLLVFRDALPVKTKDSVPLDSLIKQGQLAIDADVVFPVVHGPLYEDGCLQGLLELAGVAYVGCGVLSSAVGMDKDMARRIVCGGEVQSVAYRRLTWSGRNKAFDTFCRDTVAALGWPLFVKPCSMGSSVGIHKVHTVPELIDAIEDARHYDEDVLVEAFAEGREIEVAVLENIIPFAKPKVSVPGEISVHHPDGFYSYSAKYLESEHTDLQAPAQLEPHLVNRLQQIAADVFIRLKCQGMARVDFFVDDQRGIVYFNEINTIPGFTSISMYPRMWQASGLSYGALIDQLIELAIVRRRRRDRLVTHYK
jgi:D-alanine-D-alanine ligase